MRLDAALLGHTDVTQHPQMFDPKLDQHLEFHLDLQQLRDLVQTLMFGGL